MAHSGIIGADERAGGLETCVIEYEPAVDGPVCSIMQRVREFSGWVCDRNASVLGEKQFDAL